MVGIFGQIPYNMLYIEARRNVGDRGTPPRGKLTMKMSRRKKKILVTLGILSMAVILVLLNTNTIIRFIYHNRLIDGPPMNTKRKALHTPTIVNFLFELEDADFLNAFANTFSNTGRQTRPVVMEIDGVRYTAEMSRFKNYFKKLKLNDVTRGISLRFEEKRYYKGYRSIDFYQLDYISLLEQELVYKLARELGIIVPYTDCPDINVHEVYQGISFLKQTYDDIFLEENHLPHAIIFMLEKQGGKKWNFEYIYNEYDQREHPVFFRHLQQFARGLEERDPHLLVKFFDLDYMARFETLRRTLDASSGFIMAENTRFIYNVYNGKLYPVLDESNLYNLQTGSGAGHFDFLRRQIQGNRRVDRLKAKHMAELAGKHTALSNGFLELEKQYFYKKCRNPHTKMRTRLVASYFKNNVYPGLQDYLKNSGRRSAQAPAGSGSELFLNAGDPTIPPPGFKPALQRNRNYLDRSLLSPEALFETYHNLRFRMSGKERIILEPDTYIVRYDVFIPRGYLMEIEGGTTLRMAPDVSFVSYSPVHIKGSPEKPVVIKAMTEDRPFGAFAVLGDGGEDAASLVEYLDFSGGSQTRLFGCNFPGGMNFHDMNAEIRHSNFHHNKGHDALNAKGGMISLENNRFFSNAVDHAALDFCKGVVIQNRFTDDTADREGDGLDLSHSKMFVSENIFEKFLDKGLSIGEDSLCLLYKNVIRHSRIGAAAKNRARLLLLDNNFYDNNEAVAAYSKDPMFGGGNVYLMSNRFSGNEQLYKIDKESQVFTIGDGVISRADFQRSIAGKQLDKIFSVVDGIIEKYRHEENEVDFFSIGGHRARVDEKNKVIVAHLPQGAETEQSIYCKPRLDSAEIFIEPVCYGIDKVEKDDRRPFRLEKDQLYDFKEYIFYGKIILKYQYQHNEYELYVTTGNLTIVDIDTSGAHGMPRIVKNEPKIDCKMRFFSIHKPNLQQQTVDYTNRYLEARIEGRGKKLPKWKYGITLSTPYPLEGMKASKHWVLESSFIEKSLMRTKLSFDLLEQFRGDKQRRRIAPQSRFVEIMFNGRYRGVYLLMEHIDKNFLGLEPFDKNKEFNSLLFRARNINANFSPFNSKSFEKKYYRHLPNGRQPLEKADDPIQGWHSGFEQRYPHKKRHGEYWKPLDEFSRMVALAPEKEFERKTFTLMDRDSYIDLWVFTQLVDDSDGLYKNRYITRRRGPEAKWYIIPWDKDGVLGRKHNMERRSHKKWLSTPLFKRCMNFPVFQRDLRGRWNFLKQQGIITTENIYGMIDANIAHLGDARVRNFKRWPANYYMYPDRYDFEDETGYMKEWIGKRIKWLDKRFNREE